MEVPKTFQNLKVCGTKYFNNGREVCVTATIVVLANTSIHLTADLTL
jgi:hypothetical protein